MLFVFLLLIPLVALGREWAGPHDAVFWGLAAVTMLMAYSLLALRVALKQAHDYRPDPNAEPAYNLPPDLAEYQQDLTPPALARQIERLSKLNMLSTLLAVLVGIYVLLR